MDSWPDLLTTVAPPVDDLYTTGQDTTSAPVSANFTYDSNATYDYACWLLEDQDRVLLSHKIYLYSSLVFMALGLVGNLLSVLVFSSKDMRVVSSNVYLLVLAISDTLYLASVFLSKNLTYIRCMFFRNTDIDIYNQSTFFCKSLQYVQDFFSNYSTCVILAFTIERYVAVYRPIKFKDMYTVGRARVTCLVLFLVIAVYIAPYHVMYMYRYERFNVCTVLISEEKKFTILFGIEALLFRIIPVFVITVLNVFIILRVSHVTKMSRRRRSMASSARNGSRAAGSRKKTTSRSRKDERSLQLTLMLILVSTTYVLTYLPVLVHFIIWKLQRSQLVTVDQDAMLIARNYTCALYIAGFAINFFLYTMSGRVFREQLQVVLCTGRSTKVRGVRNAGYTGMLTVLETDL
ncbi:hypothetical protein LSH36_1394g00005 [Paralvinella palmiformis]|uniref:G-protein coupled receptors family 1 profile domain-containing protein n=1 Tax=Paralvinella palmiformis TaxID=53620 RepID=A0AAD9MNC0_9ANNE|nr:hypothetical protein LSH36_1394g00005 [Paralvinella palmiformis]